MSAANSIFRVLLVATMLANNSVAGDVPLFEVSPSLCVLESGQSSCSLTLRFQWRRDGDESVCIYQASPETKLFCSTQEQLWRYTTTLNNSTDYILVMGDEVHERARVTVQLNHIVATIRPRRRAGWSVF